MQIISPIIKLAQSNSVKFTRNVKSITHHSWNTNHVEFDLTLDITKTVAKLKNTYRVETEYIKYRKRI